MKTFTLTLSVTLSLLASSTQAQQDYRIDPNNVPLSLRKYWCSNQQTQCPLICLQTPAHSSETLSNTCDPHLLTYACICSNNLSPNLTQYSQTLPFFLCQEWGNECASNCGSDNTCVSSCRQDHPCGAQSPAPPNKTLLTTTRVTAKMGETGKGGVAVCSGFAAASGSCGVGAAAKTGGGGEGNGAGAVRVPWVMEGGRGFGVVALVGGVVLGMAVLL